MTYVQTIGISRVRDGSAWWSIVIVAVLHVLLLLWLTTLHWSVPLRPFAAAMVLVDLRTAPETIAGDKSFGVAAARREPSPTNGRQSSTAAAARYREHTPMDLEKRAVTVTGTQAPGGAVASQQASSPIEGTAVSGLGTSRAGDAAAPGGDGARARGKLHPPEVVRRWRPDYPLDAFQARKQGSVDVMVTIGADASVIDAHLFQSSGSDSLDRAAVEAVKRYVFRPARRDREEIEAQAIVTIDWVILGDGVSTTRQ
jgi:TonB family protein